MYLTISIPIVAVASNLYPGIHAWMNLKFHFHNEVVIGLISSQKSIWRVVNGSSNNKGIFHSVGCIPPFGRPAFKVGGHKVSPNSFLFSCATTGRNKGRHSNTQRFYVVLFSHYIVFVCCENNKKKWICALF